MFDLKAEELLHGTGAEMYNDFTFFAPILDSKSIKQISTQDAISTEWLDVGILFTFDDGSMALFHTVDGTELISIYSYDNDLSDIVEYWRV